MVFAAQTTQGYVAYSVTLGGPSGDKSFVINETVQSSSSAGLSNFFLNLVGQDQHLTYSRVVNSSANLFPYLPILSNQSLSYAGKNYSFTLTLTTAGTGTLNFQGSSQSTKSFGLAFSATYGARTFKGTGSIVVFPSALVYSAAIQTDASYNLKVVLTATNLPLVDPPGMNQTAAVITAGAGIGAAALVILLLIRRRRNSHINHGTADERPIHWAD